MTSTDLGRDRAHERAQATSALEVPIVNGAAPGATVTIERATNFVSRGIGLLGRRGLPSGTALLIRPCSSVHTFGMRFTIDVAYLDRAGRVTKVVPRLRPWRMSRGARGSHAVLEFAAGEAVRLGIIPGAVIDVQ